MNCLIRGEKFLLHSRRVLVWPAERLLVVADIHLGKAQTFLKSGLWLPPQAHVDDLDQLLQVAIENEIGHIIFLGDFVHSVEGSTQQAVREFAQWKKKFPGEVTVVIGNHDRPFIAKWPVEWSFVKLVETLKIRDFIFQHEPPTGKHKEFVWCGHIHPKISLKHGGDRLYLPAFVVTPAVGYLPAYSRLAGGAAFKYAKANRYFVASEGQVVEVTF